MIPRNRSSRVPLSPRYLASLRHVMTCSDCSKRPRLTMYRIISSTTRESIRPTWAKISESTSSSNVRLGSKSEHTFSTQYQYSPYPSKPYFITSFCSLASRCARDSCLNHLIRRPPMQTARPKSASADTGEALPRGVPILGPASLVLEPWLQSPGRSCFQGERELGHQTA